MDEASEARLEETLNQPSREPAHCGGSPVEDAAFDIDTYLSAERAKDLLRLSTAGSVDDGKSTLIGRLLYDSNNIYEDQLRSIEGKGLTVNGVPDLALITDGLRAEREQGITIDVAYRYFSTRNRNFIIADTPGHEQYTRNMATGASTADAAVILVDARKGLLPQTRRHAYIALLLGVRSLLLTVNKMDLVGYSEQTFQQICNDFQAYLAVLENHRPELRVSGIPVSALNGDNVVHRASSMPWYRGLTLLGILESLPSSMEEIELPFRFPIQRVVRPNPEFRGYAGQIASGRVRPGDLVKVLPGEKSCRIEKIITFEGELSEAVAPLSVTLTLDHELDISRGNLIVAHGMPAFVGRSFQASIVWMDDVPLEVNRRYLLKHACNTVSARVCAIREIADVTHGGPNGSQEQRDTLAMNDIGVVRIEVSQPIAVDSYRVNRFTGSFILVDTRTNATAAAGMIRSPDSVYDDAQSFDYVGMVSASERRQRYGHVGAQIFLRGKAEYATALERALFDRGALVLLWDELAPVAVERLVESGMLILTFSGEDNRFSIRIAQRDSVSHDFAVENIEEAVKAALDVLKQAGVLAANT